jgi:hypothetical protein
MCRLCPTCIGRIAECIAVDAGKHSCLSRLRYPVLLAHTPQSPPHLHIHYLRPKLWILAHAITLDECYALCMHALRRRPKSLCVELIEPSSPALARMAE